MSSKQVGVGLSGLSFSVEETKPLPQKRRQSQDVWEERFDMFGFVPVEDVSLPSTKCRLVGYSLLLEG